MGRCLARGVVKSCSLQITDSPQHKNFALISHFNLLLSPGGAVTGVAKPIQHATLIPSVSDLVKTRCIKFSTQLNMQKGLEISGEMHQRVENDQKGNLLCREVSNMQD